MKRLGRPRQSIRSRLAGESFSHVFWNFVSSRKARIEQAKADWAAGRFAMPPEDNQEWIPLPG